MIEKQVLIDWNVTTSYQSDTLDINKTLVFLHGWWQSGKTFEKILKLLEKDRVSYISFDLPWFWKTQIQNLDAQIEDYGNFVQKAIEKYNLKNPILIGHSFGWRISIYLWSYYKNLEKIVLIGSAGIKAKQNSLKLVVVKTGKYIFKLPFLKPFFKTIREKVISKDNKDAGKMQQIFLNTIGNDLQKYMEKITFPTLMIRWENDTATPLEEGKIIHSKIQNSQFIEIPEGTHFVYQEFPEDVYSHIKKFIN